MDKLEIGGNSTLLKLGNRLIKLGTKYINKGAKVIVTNPSCKFHNPYILVISFTVNATDKYQLILESNYKEKYKEYREKIKDIDTTEEGISDPITQDEMFILIRDRYKEWFLKD